MIRLNKDYNNAASRPCIEAVPVMMAENYELFKTSSHFDSSAKHPDWSGGGKSGVQALAPSA
ncbi:MAG TPA: hypothetical protein VMR80_04405 [Candidatus Acidoferrum sp.]|nr:hypothetical protein [Candidatus Acidoferrum sp.]